jgi:hypothetical protein
MNLDFVKQLPRKFYIYKFDNRGLARNELHTVQKKMLFELTLNTKYKSVREGKRQ